MVSVRGSDARSAAAARLIELRKAAGLSQAAAADLAGCGQSDIAKLEIDQKVFTVAWAARLAPVYKVSVSELASLAMSVAMKQPEIIHIPDEQSVPSLRTDIVPPDNVDISRLTPYSDLVGETDLPVFGSAEGGPNGSLIIDNSAVEWVKRPQPLFRVPKGFATFVIGSSMEPAYYPGDRLLIHPSRPPLRNSDVVIYRENPDGTANALVKRLTRFDDTQWFLKQYNPEREFELPRSEWPRALQIVGKYSR